MKAIRLVLVFALVALAFGLYQAPAQAAGAFSYTSSIQVQNLEGTQANISIVFYNQDGSVNTTVPDTIPANGSKSYFPLPVGDNFNGSVVISSNTQIASISNVVGNNFAAAAAYVASNNGSNSVLLPLLMKGNSGFNTWFNVQNTSSSADASVTIAYSDGTNSGAAVAIKPGASHTFYQSDENHSLKVFSGVVSSNQPVAVTVIEESSKVMFAYSGFTAGTTNPVLPLINANNSGYQTGVAIQNAGNADTSVTLSYTHSLAGTDCTETQTIPAGKMANFALNAFAGAPLTGMTTTCAGGVKFIGSAKVTTNSASQPLVAVVNQLKNPINGEAYGGFDAGTVSSKVVLPLIMDRNSGYWTSINMMNVGSSPATVTCTFVNNPYTFTQTLAPNAGYSDLELNKLADKYVGAATCTGSTASDKIVAVVNELGPSSTADQLLVYEGINATAP